MSENFQNKISTGTFARLCSVPKKTLLYYDEIGLFQPDHIAQNGYRYYSYRQIDLFLVILGLREIGMPLKEIKEYIVHRTPKDMIQLFMDQDLKIQKEIRKLKLTRQFLQIRLKLTQEALQIPIDSIQLEVQENAFLAVTDTSKLNSKDAMFEAWINHTHKYIENGMNVGYPEGTMVRLEDIIQKNCLNYAYIFTRTDRPFHGEFYYEKPKGLYVTAYHKGSYESTEHTYEKMLHYAKEQQLELTGFAFEDGMLDELVVQSAEDLLLKISIAVKEKPSALF